MNGTRFQRGHLYEAFGSFHVKFYQTEVVDLVLVRRRRSKRLCAVDKEHDSTKAKPVKLLFAEFMRKVNASTVTEQNIPVSQFWEVVYIPYCEEILKMIGKPRKKPSTCAATSRFGTSICRSTSPISRSRNTTHNAASCFSNRLLQRRGKCP